MRLFELFTQTRDIKWSADQGEHVAEFSIGQHRYRITFRDEPLRALKLTARNMPDVMETLNKIRDDAKIVRVEFSLQVPMGHGYHNTKYDKTGTGNQYAVFATVIEAIKQSTQKYGYDHVRIIAEEPNRQRLYRRMIKAMPHKNVYENQDPMSGYVTFIVEL